MKEPTRLVPKNTNTIQILIRWLVHQGEGIYINRGYYLDQCHCKPY